MSIFDKFASQIDEEGLRKDIEDARNNKPSFDKPEDGKYEVTIDNMEPKLSKAGKPMLSIQFRVIAGPLSNQCIFYNQTFFTKDGAPSPFLIGNAITMLESLDIGPKVTYESISQFGDLITELFEQYQKDPLEYEIMLKTNAKNPDFQDMTITEVFGVDTTPTQEDFKELESDDELPF